MGDPVIACTVIVSTRNRAHFLADCLASLSAQRCSVPYEIVVVDNGSTDSTPQVLEEWRGKEPRLRTAREDRVGVSRGKNAGIRMARGSLLLFTDDDVRADPRWIQSYKDLFSRIEADLVLAGGPIEPIAEDLGTWPNWFHPDALIDLGLWTYPEERRLEASEYVFGANMAAPADLFRRFGPWDENLGPMGDDRTAHEDTELQDRVRPAGVPVWFCPAAIVQHRVSPEHASARSVISRAFARGRNDFWKEGLRRYGDEASVPKQPALSAALSLGARLAREAVRIAAFRASRDPRSFNRARLAAWRTGWAMETLRPGRATTRLFRGIGRVTLWVQTLLPRLVPAASDAAPASARPPGPTAG